MLVQTNHREQESYLTGMKHPKVAIISKYIPVYRLRFYELLDQCLAKRGVDLLVIYGQPGPRDMKKKDAADFPEGIFVRSQIYSIGNLELYWQPVYSLIKDVDLVIVEQASKLLINYPLWLQNALGIKKMALWGHGKNFQSEIPRLNGEWLKKRISTKVHWWFAYNNMSARVVHGLGYPLERITVVHNAIDTHQLKTSFKDLRDAELDKLRRNLGIMGNHVGLYVGAMYPEKRLGFLLEALLQVRQEINDFEMIFIGSGIDAPLIIERAKEYSWIHYVGPKFDLEKVPYFASSHRTV